MSTSIGRNTPCHCGSGRKYKVCHLPQEQASDITSRKPKSDEPGVIVCMPTRGTINFETHMALARNLRGPYKTAFVMAARKLIVEARNELARSALHLSKNNPFEVEPREWFALWIDDDAWWTPDTVGTMLDAMRNIPSLDALFGWFSARVPYSNPMAYRSSEDANSSPRPGLDCVPGEIVEVQRAGFHFVLMRTSLLERVGETPFDLTEDAMSEDFAFCKRAVAVGAKLGVGTGFPILHVDPSDGVAYQPGMPPLLMADDGSIQAIEAKHVTPAGVIKEPEARTYGAEFDEKMAARESTKRVSIDAALDTRAALFA